MRQANTVYSQTVCESEQKIMAKLRMGKLRNHKLGNSATEHSGELLENELKLYCEYLPTKNFYNILDLKGNRNYE